MIKTELIAVFDRCCYLQLQAQPAIALVCIGNQSIGPGPINLLVADNHWQLLRPRLRTGAFADIGQNHLLLAGLRIDLSTSDTYCTPELASFCRTDYTQILDRLLLLLQHAQSASLYPLVLAFNAAQASPSGVTATNLDTAMRAYLSARVNTLREELCTALVASDFSTAAELLGAGAGLTPAGDDLLAGVLLALRFCGHTHVAANLFRQIQPLLLERTNVISAALLVEAGAGRTSPTLISVFAALGDPTVSFDERALATVIGAVGHSSGWDCVAGIALVLQALIPVTRNSPVQPSESLDLTLTRQLNHA